MYITIFHVIQCDICKDTINVVQNDEDLVVQVGWHHWHDGAIYQICPKCLLTDDAAVKLKLEKDAFDNAVNKLETLEKEEKSNVEYVH